MRKEDAAFLTELGLSPAFVESIPGGYHLCENDPANGFPYVYMSDRFLDILGWTREEIAEKFDNQYSRMVHPEDLERGEAYHPENEAAGPAVIEDRLFRMLGKQGYVWITSSARETIFKGKSYIQAVHVAVNTVVNEREQIRKDLTRTMDEVDHRNLELRHQLAIINSLSKIFSAIYYIDLSDNSFIELGQSLDGVSSVIGKKGDAVASFNKMLSFLVDADHLDSMREFTDLSTLQERLKDDNWISSPFIGPYTGWTEGVFIPADRDENGLCRHVIWAVKSIQEQMDRELTYQKEIRETMDCIAYANIGTWRIIDVEGQRRLMKVNDDMREILSIPPDMTDEADIFDYWYSRIDPAYHEKVEAARLAMNSATKAEVTFIWHDPKLGKQYYRFVGSGEVIGENSAIARGLFHNVNEAVLRETREAAERQRVSDLRFQTMAEAIHGGFMLGENDAPFTFKMVSDQLAHLLGYDSPQDMITAADGCMLNLVPEEDRESELPKALNAVESGEMYTMNYRVRCKDGSLKNVEDRGRLIFNEKGVGEKWSFIVDQDLLKEMELANEAKSNFLFNMSHDIRIPMNAILGYAHLVRKELTESAVIDRDKVMDYQEKIEHSGNVLLSIINNVLDMARIESGKVTVDEEYVDTTKVIAQLMSVFEADAREKNITMTSSWDVPHTHLLIDQTKVKEIFLNLVSNALKYTPSGGSIDITAIELPCEKEGYIRVQTTIADTGIGMSPDYLPHLFDAFTRERNSTTTKVIGTGLGMPIVKKLVDLLGGTIEVKSELGKGTTFFLTMEHRLADETYYKAKKRISDEDKKAILQGKHILLAEDNELNAEIALTILGDSGFNLTHVEDGVQCVAEIEKQPAGTYDFILMDIQMPNMDGYKATQVIRSLPDPAKAGIPIIAMTANAFEEDKKNAFAVGMNGHIAKPINIDMVNEAILAVFTEEMG